jgi:hypothetical protein
MEKPNFVSENGVLVEFKAQQTGNIFTDEITGKHFSLSLNNGDGGECRTTLTRNEAWKLIGILIQELKQFDEMQP